MDGWANRDLKFGEIVSLAPNRQPISDLLKIDVATVKHVLESWRTGRVDLLLYVDGKAFRPEGEQAEMPTPAAFDLAGVKPL